MKEEYIEDEEYYKLPYDRETMEEIEWWLNECEKMNPGEG